MPSRYCVGPASPTCPQSSWALGDRGAVAGHSRRPVSRDSTHAAPLGGLTPPRGFKCHLGATPASPPSPTRFLMPPWGPCTGQAGGNPDLGSGQPPAPSPQPPAPSPQAGRVQPTHIWSQGSRRSGPSRSGPGSLTKMSPLQVTDQMACGEGRPCTLRLSQQDRLSRVSWQGGEAGQRGRAGPKTGAPTPAQGTPACLPSRSCPAQWQRPGARATSAAFSRGCTGRRSAWPH